MSTPITLTGAYTCTHHNDKQRTECPVCLVATLRARADRAEADLAALEQSFDANCRGVVRIADDLTAATAERDQLRAQLHALRLVCGTTDADKFTTWVDRANARAEKAEAEAERYRLVTLKQDAELATAKERLRSEAMDDYAAIKDLQRELATERGKLDWVFQNCKVEANDYTTGNLDVYYVHDREDLGVAMQEDAN